VSSPWFPLASGINTLWRELCRRADPSINYSRSSLIPLPHPVIVPGGRFREIYYWDSYFIVLGLLGSGMPDTAGALISPPTHHVLCFTRHTGNVVDNLLSLVASNGFVPNGARVYYKNRSQPPMLTQMVKAIAHTRSLQWLRDAVVLLDQEYDWWDRQHLDPATNLSRYLPYDAATLPRPESYREDEAVVKDMTAAQRNFTLGALIGGAESGWDFSSRWIRANGEDLRNISTQSVLPVCLNSILYSNERILAELHSQLSLHASSKPSSSSSSSSFSFRSCLNHTLKSQSYAQRSQQRAAAMRALMWSATQSRWHDSCTNPPCPLLPALYASSVIPLWAGLGLGPGDNNNNNNT
jgi:alpha,alpha-trehalase